jgi:hypothetical protein
MIHNGIGIFASTAGAPRMTTIPHACLHGLDRIGIQVIGRILFCGYLLLVVLIFIVIAILVRTTSFRTISVGAVIGNI